MVKDSTSVALLVLPCVVKNRRCSVLSSVYQSVSAHVELSSIKTENVVLGSVYLLVCHDFLNCNL